MPRRSARNKLKAKKRTVDQSEVIDPIDLHIEGEQKKASKPSSSENVTAKSGSKKPVKRPQSSLSLPAAAKKMKKEPSPEKNSAAKRKQDRVEKIRIEKLKLAEEKERKNRLKKVKEQEKVAKKLLEDRQTFWNDSDVALCSAEMRRQAGSKPWEWDWDRCGVAVGHDTSVNAGFGTEVPTATRNIILIRHGQYSSTLPKDADRVLTEIGMKQSTMAGKRLADVIPRISSISHSTMKRAEQTAQLIADQLKDFKEPIMGCDLIREGAPVPPTPESQAYRPNERQIHEDAIRIEAAFRKYFHRAELSQTEDTHDVVVCHANVIRYFLCRALQMPLNGWMRLSVTNSSITWLAIEPTGRVWLRQMGDGGYMPKKVLTFT